VTKHQKLSAVLFATLILAIYLVNKFYFSKRPIVYPNFGIEVPAGYTTHGIDVSHYQHNIDWELVTKMRDKGQRISFAIVKATEGTNQLDNRFKSNWNELQDYELIRGAYLYLHANQNGKTQANYFISKVDLQDGDLAPIIDIEETMGMNNTAIQKVVKECAIELEEHYKCKPIIYSNVDFYKRRLNDNFNEYPFWAAHYERSNEPRINRDWHIWQHSCKGRVNGIDAEVDFNVVNGSISDLKKLCLE
jgi:lysozyme